MSTLPTELRVDESQSPTFGHLERYTVEGLFGTRDFEFETAAEGPTVLTGTNGTGKSTVLRSIDAISVGNWLLLSQLPFEAIHLDFSDGSRLTAANRADGVELLLGEQRWVFRLDEYVPRSIGRGEPLPRGVQPAARGFEYEGKTYHQHDLERTLGIRDMLVKGDALWVASLPAQFPVLFITDQRLVVRTPFPRGRYATSAQLVPRASNSEGDLRRITDAVLGHATALAEAAGRLRHLSTVESLELSFERLKLRKYRDKTSRCVDAARIARAVVMNSGSDESAGELAQRASEVGGGLSVCNGHDLVESIRTVLHQDFGVPYNRLESLDDLLRSNITRDALARWPGLARVRHWERTTRRKVLNV